MKSQTDVVNGTEATYKNAVNRAYNAAALRAEGVPQNPIGHPIDHSAQAALENGPLTGRRFEVAYEELWQTIYHLSNACDDTDEMARELDRVKTELLRVTFGN